MDDLELAPMGGGMPPVIVQQAAPVPWGKIGIGAGIVLLLLLLLRRGKSNAGTAGVAVLRAELQGDRARFIGGPLRPVELLTIPRPTLPDGVIELEIFRGTERAWQTFQDRAGQLGWNCIVTDGGDRARCTVVK